jgi:hypothetical protein
VIVLLIVQPATGAGSQRRSEPRDQAHAQRHIVRRAQTASGNRSIAPQGSSYCESCERDVNGRIRRSPVARRAFQASHPCPATGSSIGACPGYVVDHIVPLKRGGMAERGRRESEGQNRVARRAERLAVGALTVRANRVMDGFLWKLRPSFCDCSSPLLSATASMNGGCAGLAVGTNAEWSSL